MCEDESDAAAHTPRPAHMTTDLYGVRISIVPNSIATLRLLILQDI
jgi:hypothetical protein